MFFVLHPLGETTCVEYPRRQFGSISFARWQVTFLSHLGVMCRFHRSTITFKLASLARHMMSSFDVAALRRFELTRLHRISVGPIVLGDVEEGSCRELTRREVEALYKRCLPEDPLCPTIDAVQDILKSRLSQTARRIRTTAEVGGHRFKAREHSSAMDVPQKDAPERPTAEDAEQRRAAKARDGERGCRCRTTQGPGRRRAKAFATEEDLTCIVKRWIDFARRDLHETPAGPNGESAGPDYCPGEKESLAQARAVPPNETHMVCGYRSSQIERLGLTYGTM